MCSQRRPLVLRVCGAETIAVHACAAALYGEMGDVDAARALFDAVAAHRSTHSLNVMMAAAQRNGLFDDAMVLYDDDDDAHAKDVRRSESAPNCDGRNAAARCTEN